MCHVNHPLHAYVHTLGELLIRSCKYLSTLITGLRSCHSLPDAVILIVRRLEHLDLPNVHLSKGNDLFDGFNLHLCGAAFLDCLLAARCAALLSPMLTLLSHFCLVSIIRVDLHLHILKAKNSHLTSEHFDLLVLSGVPVDAYLAGQSRLLLPLGPCRFVKAPGDQATS